MNNQSSQVRMDVYKVFGKMNDYELLNLVCERLGLCWEYDYLERTILFRREIKPCTVDSPEEFEQAINQIFLPQTYRLRTEEYRLRSIPGIYDLLVSHFGHGGR